MNIALLGFGTVGRGVDEILSTRDLGMAVTRILELPERLSDARMTADYDEILGDESVDVVVECMGGIEPAHSFIVAALRAGKSVVTSNKAVVAAHLPEFVALASEKGVAFQFEASCGGGVPWIASIAKAARVDEISSISGIMNGTTNYIIYHMQKDNADFGEVLAKAQELGYAERDPSADIDGFDVRNKTLIAASLAFGSLCTSEIPMLSMRNISKADLDLFAGQGLSVKLLGKAVKKDGAYAVAVEPSLVASDSLEANVSENNNLLTLVGETVGELKFYGQGAGALPTGNAIVQDLVDIKEKAALSYDFAAELTLDEELLRSDYIVRTTTELDAPTWLADGYYKLSDKLPREMVALVEELKAQDAQIVAYALRKDLN